MSKIVQLQTENVKRLKAVTIKPDGTLVIIGGNNAQGKTSVLDSIAMALGGKDQIPSVPIRKGETKASTVVDLGDIVVKRTFTAAGGSSLVIEDKDKKRFPSPQALLDSLTGRLAFDPLSFLTRKPAQQFEDLRELVGLDFTADEQEHQKLYTERTVVNREVDRAKHNWETAQSFADITEAVDLSKLQADLEEATAHNSKLNGLQSEASAQENKLALAKQAVADNARYIADLESQIAELQAKLTTSRNKATVLTETSETAQQAADIAKKAVSDFKLRDLAAIQSQLAGGNEVNRKHTANQTKKTLLETFQAKQKESESLTKQLSAVEDRKEKKLAAAKFPVAGLSFGSGEVLFNGLPLEQASDAERMRVSVAMAAAMNPKIRVALVRNGSLLDAENLALLGKLAEEHDLQVWVERVGTADPSSIIIEDGMVKGEEAPKTEFTLEAK